MKIKLKMKQGKLELASYAIRHDFDFSSALYEAIKLEGSFDDDSDTGVPTSTQSSPLSSPPSSPLSSSLRPPSPLYPPSPTPTEYPPKLESSCKIKRKAARGKARSKRNRKRQRQEAPPKTADEISARRDPVTRYVLNNAAFQVSFSMEEDAPVASTAYVGLLDKQNVGGRRTWKLNELVGPGSKGFTLIEAQPGTTIPLADASSRVMGVIVYPNDASLAQCAEEAAQLVKKTRPRVSFTAKQSKSRRGDFGQLNVGIAHGGGRMKPGNIANTKRNAVVLQDLVSSNPFRRLSGYATGVFKTWAPKLYDYCSSHFESLLENDSSLHRVFDTSVMASAAFNFGPRTVCLPHIDFGNLPFLWCWIWGLGWYNPKTGGHLVLWDLKLVVEFPPGSLIAIPSGVCRHGNTAVSRKETRYSFTQYSSGGNFRWVDHGFQTEEAYRTQRTAEEAKKEELRRQTRWEMGLNLFSTIEELGLCT